MIVVVEHSAKVVWGYGHTPGEAMNDAKKHIDDWQRLHPRDRVGDLEYAQIDDALIRSNNWCDGEDLYRFLPEQSTPVQDSLF